MGDETKAMAIPRRYSKMCEVCMLIDTEKDNVKFFVYDEGTTEAEDKYICEGCLDGVRDIRKKCNQKIDNPKHNIFQNFVPWFAKDVPGTVEKFKEAMA